MSNFTNKLKEKLPDILMATGILGHVGGLVLGCVATTKVPDIMDEYRAKLAEAALIEDEDKRKKAIRKVKGWLVWQMTKNYAGTAAVEGLSIASELGAYTQVKKTCAELAVTVGVLDGALKAIKERTTDDVGAEKADDIWLGGKTEVTEPEEKNENGEVVKEAKSSVCVNKTEVCRKSPVCTCTPEDTRVQVCSNCKLICNFFCKTKLKIKAVSKLHFIKVYHCAVAITAEHKSLERNKYTKLESVSVALVI